MVSVSLQPDSGNTLGFKVSYLVWCTGGSYLGKYLQMTTMGAGSRNCPTRYTFMSSKKITEMYCRISRTNWNHVPNLNLRRIFILLIGVWILARPCLASEPSSYTVEFRHSEIFISESQILVDAPLVATGFGDLSFEVIGEIVGGSAIEGTDFQSTPDPQRRVQFGRIDDNPPIRLGVMEGVRWITDDLPDVTKTITLELVEVRFNPRHPHDRVALGGRRKVTIHVIDDDGGVNEISGLEDSSYSPAGFPTNVKMDSENILWARNAKIPSVFSMTESGNLNREFESFHFEDRSPDEPPRRVVIQNLYPRPEGIYVCGTFTHFRGEPVGRIVRLKKDGHLDPAFRLESSPGDFSFRLAFDDTFIYAIGLFQSELSAKPLRRFYLDGSVDSSYRPDSSGPIIVHDPEPGYLSDISIGPNGSLLVAGFFSEFDGERRTGVVRLTESGHLDKAFRFFPQQSNTEIIEVYRVAISESENIFVCGERLVNRGFNGIEKLNENGTTDHSWFTNYPWDSGVVPFFVHDGFVYAGLRRYSVQDGSLDRTFPARKLGRPLTVTPDSNDRLNVFGRRIYTKPTAVPPSTVSFARSEYYAVETDGKMVVQLVRNFSGIPCEVQLQITNRSATEGLDYTVAKKSVVFPERKSRVPVEITVSSDNLVEEIENFEMQIIGVSYGEIGAGRSAQFYIADHPSKEVYTALDEEFRSKSWFPQLIDQAPGGNVWITKNEVVKILTNEGKLIKTIVLDFSPQTVTAVDHMSVIVGDGNHIVRMDNSGAIEREFETSVRSLRGISIDNHDRIYAHGESLLRFTYNGLVDPAFDSIPPIFRSDSIFPPDIHAIAVQPDGKIVIAGEFDAIGGVVRQGIARLDADGALDLSFRSSIRARGWGKSQISIDPAGRIILGFIGGKPLVRLNQDGSLDDSFDSSLFKSGNDLHFMGDGKFLISGVVFPDSERKQIAFGSTNGLEIPFSNSPLGSDGPTTLSIFGRSGDSGLFIVDQSGKLKRLLLPNSVGAQYDLWRNTSQFGNILSDRDSGAPKSDVDGDGVANVFEFVAGTSPINPGDYPLSRLTSVPPNSWKLSLEPFLRQNANPKWLRLLQSNDLQRWVQVGVSGDRLRFVGNRLEISLGKRGVNQEFWRITVNN